MSDECSEDQWESVAKTVDGWYDAFSASPGFALLTESERDSAGAVVDFFARCTWDYLGLPPAKWNAAAVRECLTDILPRQVSDDPPFFETVAPVLSRFFIFLEEEGLLRGAGKLGEAARKSHQAIVAAAGDPSNWGPAKQLAMAARESGVDFQDPKALEAFIQDYNLRIQQSWPNPVAPAGPGHGQPASGRNAPFSWAEVDPYAPCPCGSGRKFKFCCREAFRNAPFGGSDAEPPRAESNPSAPDDGPPRVAKYNPDLEEEVDELLRQVESGAGKAVEPQIRRLLERRPDHYLTNYAMGVYLGLVAQNPERALPFLEKAVEICPPFAEAHFNLGISAMKSFDISRAVEAFRAAARHAQGGDGIAAKAREQLGFLEKTLLKGTSFKNLDAFLANQRLFDAAFQCLADYQFDQAVEMFNQVLVEYPDHVQSYGNLALAYAGLGKKAMAMECLEKALALDPAYEPARVNRRLLGAMREGEPFIPGGIREVNYYVDRLKRKRRMES